MIEYVRGIERGLGAVRPRNAMGSRDSQTGAAPGATTGLIPLASNQNVELCRIGERSKIAIACEEGDSAIQAALGDQSVS